MLISSDLLPNACQRTLEPHRRCKGTGRCNSGVVFGIAPRQVLPSPLGVQRAFSPAAQGEDWGRLYTSYPALCGYGGRAGKDSRVSLPYPHDPNTWSAPLLSVG